MRLRCRSDGRRDGGLIRYRVAGSKELPGGGWLRARCEGSGDVPDLLGATLVELALHQVRRAAGIWDLGFGGVASGFDRWEAAEHFGASAAQFIGDVFVCHRSPPWTRGVNRRLAMLAGFLWE